MIETQALMTIPDFFGFFSRNHFLEGGFTFQWKGGCFSVSWELHFYVQEGGGGCPMRGIGFDEGFLKKNHRMEGQVPH